MTYLRQDRNEPIREDYYMAQIAAELRRHIVKNPSKVTIDSMLLQFKEVKKGALKYRTKKEASTFSRSIWFSALGIKE